MTENKSVMARNITEQMLLKNVTATDVCKACNFKQNTFSDWVNAKTYPRINNIEKMANYFGIPKFMLVEDVRTINFHTEDEEQILNAFRAASSDTKKAVRAVLGIRKE